MREKHKQPQIIDLPYRLASAEEMQGCDDLDVISFQLRLYAVEQIRLIQAGKLQPTENVVKNLKDLNASLKECKKSELPLDFLN